MRSVALSCRCRADAVATVAMLRAAAPPPPLLLSSSQIRPPGECATRPSPPTTVACSRAPCAMFRAAPCPSRSACRAPLLPPHLCLHISASTWTPSTRRTATHAPPRPWHGERIKRQAKKALSPHEADAYGGPPAPHTMARLCTADQTSKSVNLARRSRGDMPSRRYTAEGRGIHTHAHASAAAERHGSVDKMCSQHKAATIKAALRSGVGWRRWASPV